VFLGMGNLSSIGGYKNYLSGNVDLNGATRVIGLSNSTVISGVISNGGMVVDNGTGGSSKELTLSGNNTFDGGPKLVSTGSAQPILSIGNNACLGSGNLVFGQNGILRPVNTDRSLSNAIVISNVAAATMDVGTNDVVSVDPSTGTNNVTNTVTSNLALSGSISGGGALAKTNTGTLTLSGRLSYSGGTTVGAGNLVVVQTNLTTTISSNTVFIAMSNNVVAGIYPVLPGELTGIYPAATYSGPTGATATFDGKTGLVTVATVAPVTDGFADYLSSNRLPAGTAFDEIINGVAVGLKYAFNSASGMPQNNGVTAVPVIAQLQNGGQEMTYTFDVKDDFFDVNYPSRAVTYQTSSDLVTWEPTPALAVSDGTGSSPTGFLKKQVKVTGSDRVFIRIIVRR